MLKLYALTTSLKSFCSLQQEMGRAHVLSLLVLFFFFLNKNVYGLTSPVFGLIQRRCLGIVL